DASMEDIKRKLKGRRSNIGDIALRYADVVSKYAIVRGTDKDDWFDITRMPNGDTKVVGYRIKDGEKADVIHNRVYNHKSTKEIWIYALDDDDHFHIDGNGDDLIKLRLVGGLNNDVYEIKNGKKVHLYDYRSKPNTFKTNKGVKHIRDDYETNTYDYKKPRYNSNVLIPGIGGNPDDGLKIGLTNTFTKNGFERNPFTSQHTISGFFYTATSGFELAYKGEFANVLGSWNLTLSGDFSSPNFARNFFGYGNTTPNPNAEDDDNFDLDYNRVKLGKLSFGTGLVHRGEHGGVFNIGVNYQSFELEETDGRFIENYAAAFPSDEQKSFLNTEASYVFQNSDNPAFPTLGMKFMLHMGYTHNLDESNGFGYLIPSLGFAYRLVPTGDLVFATRSKAHFNFGDNFEFYQAASIGGNDGLRGYRFQRFTGKNAFYQSSDIRWNFGRKKTGILPVETGLFGGFDVGRVWVDDDLLLNPDFNNDQWNTSVGGGFFINAADFIAGSISLFNSDDGLRFAFALGFGF
ncbi:MAG: phosphoesterase, partial [Eudoraea sp.]|nr:phosphoesterase [Eudoraea sp.]